MTADRRPLRRCNRCRRVLRNEPIAGYGPKCAARYGLAPERKVRVRQPERTEVEQPVLFDLDEINEESEEPHDHLPQAPDRG